MKSDQNHVDKKILGGKSLQCENSTSISKLNSIDSCGFLKMNDQKWFSKPNFPFPALFKGSFCHLPALCCCVKKDVGGPTWDLAKKMLKINPSALSTC